MLTDQYDGKLKELLVQPKLVKLTVILLPWYNFTLQMRMGLPELFSLINKHLNCCYSST